jgi:hypothetical protein
MKICTKCKEIKSYEEFSKNQYYCKNCNKEYRNFNKEKIKNQRAKYRENNREKLRINQKEYSKNNIELILLNNAKRRAKNKNIIIDITIEDIKRIRPKNDICPLLEIKMISNNISLKDNSMTLDRIDSKKGYIKDNIWIISNKANKSKSNATMKEYEFIINNLKNMKVIESYINKNIIANIQETIDHIKSRSKRYNLSFNLDKNYLNLIYPIDNQCCLLNILLRRNLGKCSMNSPTLDRIIPELGYIKGNVCWISHRANTIKSNLNIKEMELLLNNWKKIK